MAPVMAGKITKGCQLVDLVFTLSSVRVATLDTVTGVLASCNNPTLFSRPGLLVLPVNNVSLLPKPPPPVLEGSVGGGLPLGPFHEGIHPPE